MSRINRDAQLAELLAENPFFQEAQQLAAETTGFRVNVIYLPRKSPARSGAVPVSGASAHFCELVRSDTKLLKRCDRSDESGARLCADKGHAVSYRCHAGLTEVIAPIIVEGHLVAAVNCGQVLMQKPTRSGFARVWQNMAGTGLNRRDLERAYLRLPVCTEAQIKTVARILVLTAEHLATSLRLTEGNGDVRTPDCLAQHYISYCADLVNMIESGASDEEVLTGMDRLAARLAGGGRANPEAVSSTVEYLVEHYSGEPTLDQAARRVGLAPYYLGRIFKREVGVSPAGFLRELRMLRARELLRASEAPVAEIAGRVGYVDPAYFCRHFSRSAGMSPTEWRRSSR